MTDRPERRAAFPRPSDVESATRRELAELFANRPIPDDAVLDNLELYMRPQRISEVLALSELYRLILGTHGIVVEFGVRWGRHLAVFSALRATLEPTNFYRKIVGFDTFTGFNEIDEVDGRSERVHAGAMAVTAGYEAHLAAILALHEAEAPMAHIRRFELCKGDAPDQLAKYLERFPETIIALAYFDMDLYRPTKACLALIKPHLSKGSVLAFDEVMHPEFPGEALALKEEVDLAKHQLQRLPNSPYPSFLVW